MRRTRWVARSLLPLSGLLCVMFVGLTSAWAHCDRANGPVAQAAREALKMRQFDLIAMWVGPKQEAELRQKFAQSLTVYREGGKAAKLAEMYLMDNAVRLHRAAEGLPYTGLKSAQPPANDIAVAERALDTGKLAPVDKLLASELEQRLNQLFRAAREARKHKDDSIEAGRKYADAYVRYIVFVHGLHQKIQAGPEHGVGD